MFEQYNQLQTTFDIQKENLCQSFQQLKIKQFINIQDQSDLMKKVCKKLNQNTLQIQSSQSLSCQSQEPLDEQLTFKSTSSIFSLSYDLSNYAMFNKESQPFSNKAIKSLLQIKQKCCFQSYDFVVKLNQKTKKIEKIKLLLDKQKRLKQEEIQQNLKLNCLINSLEIKLKQANQALQKYKCEEVKLKNIKNQIYINQTRLLKKEEALIYKQKINKEIKEKLQGKLEELKNYKFELELSLIKDHDKQLSFRESPQQIIQCKNGSNQTTLDTSEINQYKKLEEYFQKLNKIYSL